MKLTLSDIAQKLEETGIAERQAVTNDIAKQIQTMTDRERHALESSARIVLAVNAEPGWERGAANIVLRALNKPTAEELEQRAISAAIRKALEKGTITWIPPAPILAKRKRTTSR